MIDFGNILHKFNWPKHSKYSTLINMYVNYIKDTYGPDSIVVIDGYPKEPPTTVMNNVVGLK